MKKVIVFGNGLFAELAYFYLTHDSDYEVAGFTVDRDYLREKELFGLPVVPFDRVEDVLPPSEYSMIISIGFQSFNRLREEKYFQALAKGFNLISFISSRATTWPDLSIGKNSMIGENSSIQPYVRIGNNVIVTSAVVIGHHAVLGDHTFIGPGAVLLGGVTVEPYSFIAANATIREGVTVRTGSIIGTCVSITRDTEVGGIYMERAPRLHAKRSHELRVWQRVDRLTGGNMWLHRVNGASSPPHILLLRSKTDTAGSRDFGIWSAPPDMV